MRVHVQASGPSSSSLPCSDSRARDAAHAPVLHPTFGSGHRPSANLKPGCSGLEKHGFGEIPKKPGDNGGLGLATFCIAIHEQAKCWNARRPLLCILTLGFTRDFQAR